jgi:hypothetical protein
MDRAARFVPLFGLLLACSGTKAPKAPQPPPPASSALQSAPSVRHDPVLAANVPLMPEAVTSFGAAYFRDAVYALGGYAGKPHAYARQGQSGALWRLNLADGTWTELPGSAPVQGAPLLAFQGGLVRVGGMRALNVEGETERLISLAEVSVFEVGAGRWRELAPLPEARSSHAAVALGDRIFVFGGWTLEGQGKRGTFAKQGFVYDAAQQAWSAVEQPFELRAVAAATLDGKVAVLGGINPQGETSRAVHVYDPEQGTWTRGPDLPTDGFGMAAAGGDALYASTRDGVIYVLDKLPGRFRPAGRLAFPRFFHELVRFPDGRLGALGGISGMHFGARIRAVEVLKLPQQAPEVLRFTLDTPLSGKNRQAAFVRGDSLYVCGGNRSLEQHDFAPDDFAPDCARLDLAGLFWEALPDFPKPRQTMQTWVLDDRALFIGGFGHDGDEARAQRDAYAFDFESGRFKPAATVLDKPRTQFGLTEYADALWIFGGLDFDPTRVGGAQFEHPREVLKAPLYGEFAPSGVLLPRPRRAFGGAQLHGRYYMVGGMAGGFAPVTACDVFDFKTRRFSEFPCPAPRISPQLVAAGDKLYLAGGSTPGEDGLVPNPRLEVYDPKTRRWATLLDELPIAPKHLQMFAFGAHLLLYSAHNQEGVAQVALIRLPVE